MPRSISGSLQTRFTWTYNRAAGAMLTTTFTTAGAVFTIVLTGSSLAASELVVVERAGRPANYACGDAGTDSEAEVHTEGALMVATERTPKQT